MSIKTTVFKVGIVPHFSPMIENCASNLSTWAPPLPDWCRKPGILIEIFDLLARRIGLNYSIVMLAKDHAGSVDTYGNFDGQIGAVQRGEIDIGINLVALPELTNQAGEAVVKLLRPMTVAQAVIVVPSVKKATLMGQAFQFMLPFDMGLWLVILGTLILIAVLGKINWHFLGRRKQMLTLCAVGANLHILNLYKASLVSAYLITPPSGWLDTFEEVVDELESGNAQLIMPSEDYYSDLINFPKHYLSETTLWSRFALAMSNNPPIFADHNHSVSVSLLSTERAFRFAFDDSEVYHMFKHDCNLRLIDVPFGHVGDVYASMMVNLKQTELADELNEAMEKINIRLVYEKVKEYYKQDYLNAQKNCTWHNEYNNNGLNAVTIQSLTGVMMVFAIIGYLR